MKKKIVIVGGGTAGWLTALYIQKYYGTEADITLVESDEIGILGAGEGTVPLFIKTLKELDIDIFDFLIETNATHKVGISFENWNGDGKSYMHDFQRPYFSDVKGDFVNNLAPYYGYLIQKGENPYNFSVAKKIGYSNLSPILMNGNELCGYSFHFDAHLVAKYFAKIALHRGMKRIEGVVKEFKQKPNGDISTIYLENGYRMMPDLVFDCSGFKRLIVGRVYNTPWKTYQDRLTVNSAIPFFLPQSETEIKPYTRAIAMKYGWMWQIPLQNRWGCGYIFDDEFIDYEKAKAEVEEYLGHEIKINKLIKFRAGRFEKMWVNNVIAIGLASGFTEPLEATSIMVSMAGLTQLSKDILNNYDDKTIDEYNKFMGSYNDEIVDFLHFHYITKRTDTPFWTYYTQHSPLSPNLRKLVESYFVNKTFNVPEGNDIVFGNNNFWEVGFGLEFFDKEFVIKAYNEYSDKEEIETMHNLNIKNLEEVEKNSTSEIKFIDLVKIAYDK